jgi:hypothetical protein
MPTKKRKEEVVEDKPVVAAKKQKTTNGGAATKRGRGLAAKANDAELKKEMRKLVSSCLKIVVYMKFFLLW